MNTALPAQNPYDEVPYVSYTLHETSPAFVRSCAWIFGVDTVAPDKARILELGCAGGNNIIAIAATYPNSECIGIDLSPVQIEEGQKIIDEVGIKNLKLQCRSITNISEADGKFDYIIVHGVFSWVTKDLQKKIMEICKNNLSENGIAYISYNTLPGWSTSNAAREMMKYHTQNFTDPTVKAAQARELLHFIKNGHKTFDDNYYKQVIEHEIKVTENESDWYLLHEYLEESNIQFYFHQFMEIAESEGLQYLCETNLSTMMIDHYPLETVKILSTAGNIIRREQYIDFISNRRFRSTLLCHKEVNIKRNVLQEVISDRYFTSRFIMPEELKNYDYNSGAPLTFKLPNGMSTTTGNIIMILTFEVFSEQKNKPVKLQKIVELIIEKAKKYKVKGQIDEKAISQILYPNIFRSIFAWGIFLHMDEGTYIVEVSKKPVAFKLARYQAQHQKWVSALNHEVTSVNEIDKKLLPLLDGTNDVNSLKNLLRGIIPEDIENVIYERLNTYSKLALLEA